MNDWELHFRRYRWAGTMVQFVWAMSMFKSSTERTQGYAHRRSVLCSAHCIICANENESLWISSKLSCVDSFPASVKAKTRHLCPVGANITLTAASVWELIHTRGQGGWRGGARTLSQLSTLTIYLVSYFTYWLTLTGLARSVPTSSQLTRQPLTT